MASFRLRSRCSHRVYSLVLIFWMISEVLFYLYTSQVHYPFHHEINESHIDAVVLIAAGKHAKNTMIDQCVASLRKSGLSNNIPILIITDDPQCLMRGPIISDFVNIAIIPTKDQSSGSQLPADMNAKLLKMTMFQYIPSNINTVLYLDIDILASSTFNEHLIPSFDDEEYFESNCSLIIQPGRPHTFLERYSSGTFVAHRFHSRKCLQDWDALVSTGEYDRDQRALYSVTSCMDSICVLPHGIVKWARNMKSFWTISSPPLIHYTGGAHGTPKEIDQFCTEFTWKTNWSMRLYCLGGFYLKDFPILGLHFGKYFMIYLETNECTVL